ncbi:CDP-diacylglycerol--glycerol-3-phosphate 3-phosphatidyltransferase [Terracidiphilus gabretensis]|uniref:CDP-diacylglycerol--glycerol-3-phosphate 3-phosphatidyltransferase n=1 Tax=Terracidiphilus gabretensis TaxID=1577687 RepID=UPI001E2CDBF0|nr:CDP-diacylglycerol--glycerol-3-phosphate 3-phosphatidyltransferase [Terracidiphilus gabretensis]
MIVAEPPAMPDQASASITNPLRAAPNLLTLTRICLAPFLVMAVLEGHFVAGLALFIVAGLTDAFDGLLARLLKQRTALGQYLDPVADKLLLSTLFLVLTHKNLIPVRVTVLVFSRDVGILVVAAILYAVGRRDFGPSILGKANTVAQIVAIATVLLVQVDGAKWVWQLRQLALDATMALTILSGLHYAWVVSRKTQHFAANGTGAPGKSSS